jgi:hypothetical protein
LLRVIRALQDIKTTPCIYKFNNATQPVMESENDNEKAELKVPGVDDENDQEVDGENDEDMQLVDDITQRMKGVAAVCTTLKKVLKKRKNKVTQFVLLNCVCVKLNATLCPQEILMCKGLKEKLERAKKNYDLLLAQKTPLKKGTDVPVKTTQCEIKPLTAEEEAMQLQEQYMAAARAEAIQKQKQLMAEAQTAQNLNTLMTTMTANINLVVSM